MQKGVETGRARDPVEAQRADLEMLYRRHARAGEPYALLDFPDHPNVGDSAIWLGEVRSLRAVTGAGPAYACAWHEYDAAALERACPAGPIFLHGGGNLGDLWPHHQAMREAVLRDLPHRTVVQLPQSIHWRDARGAARFAALAAAHPDFHLHVRDRGSLGIARGLGLDATLAPDSAFALRLERPAPPVADVLMLLRTDGEAVAHDRAALATVPRAEVADWLDEAPPAPGLARDELAALRVARGAALLARGGHVLTDRLHAHILCVLMGIPHVALDNSYGKLVAYARAWTADWPGLVLAADANEAAAALGQP